MEGKSVYGQAVLALLAGFVLFCAGGFFAQSSWSGPYRVSTAQRPAEADYSVTERGSPASGDGAEKVDYPESLLPGEVIDINTADCYDLQRLPGIGEKRAGDIVAWREEHGPFQSVDELANISGIGPITLEGLREYGVTGNE